MRNKGYTILVAVAIAAMLSGCDFIRVVAGRPTSSDLRAVSMEIERAAAEAKKAEELKKDERLRLEADSLAAVQVLDGVLFKSVNEFKSRLTRELPAKYCVMMGAFSNEENAGKLVKAITEEGFRAQELPYRSGITAVFACPTDSYVELGKSFASLRTRKFFPADAWVLVNE